MPKTTIKTDNNKFSYITEPIRENDLLIKVYANDNFKTPLTRYIYDDGLKDEKDFHIDIRTKSKGSFIQAESTNPEWNDNKQ